MVLAPSHHTPALTALLTHARESGAWVVVVAAEGNGLHEALSKLLVALKPADSHLSGRTLVLRGGGRLTVLGGSEKPYGGGFQVIFMGYDRALTPSDEIALHAWRQNAGATITMGERPDELRIIS